MQPRCSGGLLLVARQKGGAGAPDSLPARHCCLQTVPRQEKKRKRGGDEDGNEVRAGTHDPTWN